MKLAKIGSVFAMGAACAASMLPGCSTVLGLDDLKNRVPDGGSDGSSSSSGASGSSGSYDESKGDGNASSSSGASSGSSSGLSSGSSSGASSGSSSGASSGSSGSSSGRSGSTSGSTSGSSSGASSSGSGSSTGSSSGSGGPDSGPDAPSTGDGGADSGDAGCGADGTSCGTNRYCGGGTCNACTPGLACNPPSPNECKLGTTSCTTGFSVCMPNGSNQANGTACGSTPGTQVCDTGLCVNCASGSSCTSATVDPCAVGTYSCATGTQQCVSGGADPAKAGMACGASSAGVCTNGRCQCPAGQAYYQGDCQACPVFPANNVYVNADPSVGMDNVCCGTTATAGFGGPCLTIGQAIQNAHTGANVYITGDSAGNASAQEQYPIHLGKGVHINATPAKMCIPGTSGQPVFSVDVDSSIVNVGDQGDYLITVGTTCQGVSPGASDGIYVGQTTAGTGNLQLFGQVIQGVRNGVTVDGGNANFYHATVHDVTNDGIHCESVKNATALSVLSESPGNGSGAPNITIYRAAAHDIFAGTNCTGQLRTGSGVQGLSVVLGEPPVSGSCQLPKADQFGVYAEGNASLLGLGGTVQCMNQDGISLRNNTSLSTNSPKVSFTPGGWVSGFTIMHSGCAGIYAEVGSVSDVYRSTISHNHWGVIQRSSASSTVASAALINLNGMNGTTVASNLLACNTEAEPGACCTTGSCPPGFDVWNNSGLPLIADNNAWDQSPPAKCTCDSNNQNCSCTGAAFGLLTPPDGTSDVNSPLQAGGTPGTTSILSPTVGMCQ